MEVTQLSSTLAVPHVASSSAADLDYDAFLQLLVAQLKNQDPLNPMEGTEYTAQLAQFSVVEQSIQTNQKLDTLMLSQSLSQAESLIGRTLTSPDGLTSGTVKSVHILSSGAVAELHNGEKLPLGAGVRIS